MASRGAELRFNVHRIPFQDDYNDIGEVLYNWCDIEFTVPGHFGDITLVMGGDNRCGEACDEEDECVEVTHFAELFDADTEELVGECYYDPSWVENCVSDGSLIYSSRVRCSDVVRFRESIYLPILLSRRPSFAPRKIATTNRTAQTPEDLCDALSEGCPNADF